MAPNLETLTFFAKYDKIVQKGKILKMFDSRLILHKNNTSKIQHDGVIAD